MVSFMAQPLHPHGKSPNTQWTGDWVGPRASTDTVAKRKTPVPAGNQTPLIKPIAKSYEGRYTLFSKM